MDGLVALLLFGAIVALSLYMTPRSTRWRELQERYPFVPEGMPPCEDSFYSVPCRVGRTRMPLAIEIHQSGLQLEVGWPLRIVMPPVLIPWDKIRLVHVSDGSPLTRPNVDLEIEHYSLPLWIAGRAGKETARWIKQEQGLVGPGPNYFFPGHSAQEAK